ncbi:MAG: hypothetical protein WC470_02400 [Candidatus Paceibacterota bacterium]
MALDDINNFLTSHQLNSALLPFKVVFIIISIFFIALITFYVTKQYYLMAEKRRIYRDFKNPSFDLKTYTLNRWKQIIVALRKKDDINYKLAIVNLESMLYDIFRELRYDGKDLNEMLPQIAEQKPISNPETIDALVYLANKVKVDPAYKVDPEFVEKIASEINDFLIELKVI